LDFVNFGGFREFRFLDAPRTRCGELWCGSGYNHRSVKIAIALESPIGDFNLLRYIHRSVILTTNSLHRNEIEATHWQCPVKKAMGLVW